MFSDLVCIWMIICTNAHYTLGIQELITEQHHAIHLLFLYPREQPIEGEASPVSCIIAPPVIYKRVYALTVSLVSKLMIEWLIDWWFNCEDVAPDLSTWRTLCPTLDRAADTTDSVKPGTKHENQQAAYCNTYLRTHTHTIRRLVILASRDDWAILRVVAYER